MEFVPTDKQVTRIDAQIDHLYYSWFCLITVIISQIPRYEYSIENMVKYDLLMTFIR